MRNNLHICTISIRAGLVPLSLILLSSGCTKSDESQFPRPPVRQAEAEARPETGSAIETVEFWTCKQHPDVRAVRDGKCPLCLAPLEKRTDSITMGNAVVYLCEDHPDIEGQDGDACPKCGKQLIKAYVHE